MNRVMWKLVYKKLFGNLKKIWGYTLADLSGKPVDEFMPTWNDAFEIYSSNKPDLFHFCPYFIAMDENFTGRKVTDTTRHKYIGSLTLLGESCKGAEFGGTKA